MDSSSQFVRELSELRETVRELTSRIFALEQAQKEGRPWAEPVSAGTPTQPPPETLPSTNRQSIADAEPRLAREPLPPAQTASVNSLVRPNLESRIGSQWLNRVGITALLVGISYFLKYAFDNNWIGASGRIAIGLALGIGVVAWSERFRSHGHTVFSFSLKAVGIGTLYLSLWAAFQVYSLIPSGVAFSAMFIVTVATVVMAWTQNAEILAALALAGGFSTPLLLATGQNHELELFGYIALLNLASLFLVVARPWRRLLGMSYLGSLLLYVAWYAEYYRRIDFGLTAAFATLFFVIFAIAALVARSPQAKGRSLLVPMALGLLNAVTYFLEMHVMLADIVQAYSAWVALGLAAFYIYLSRIRTKRQSDPTAAESMRLLHLALALGFITIAIPLYLNAHWITMGWFVESALLLLIAERLKAQLLEAFSIGALILGVTRLLVFDNFQSAQVIFNARIATYTVAIAVLGLLVRHGRNQGSLSGDRMAAVGGIALNALALWAMSLEVRDFFGAEITRASFRYPGDGNLVRSIGTARDFTYSALWMGFGGALMIVGFWKRSAFVRWQALALIAATVCKVFVYDVSSLDKGYRVVSFLVLGALLMLVSFVYNRDWLKLSR